jgi:hypothetical protein
MQMKEPMGLATLQRGTAHPAGFGERGAMEW